MRKILLLFLFLFFGCDDKDNTFEPNYLGTYSIRLLTGGGNAPVQLTDWFSNRVNISENDYYYPEIIYGRVTSIENEIIGPGLLYNSNGEIASYVDFFGNTQYYNYPTSSLVTFEYDPRMFEDEELKVKVANAYNIVTAEVTSSKIIQYELFQRALETQLVHNIDFNFNVNNHNRCSGSGGWYITVTNGVKSCCEDGNNRIYVHRSWECWTE